MALNTSYRYMARYLGVGAVCRSLLAGAALRYCPASGVTRALLSARNDALARGLAKLVEPALEKYQGESAPAGKNDGDIWMYWQQGLAAAPENIRKSVESIRRHAGGRAVHVLDETSAADFTALPDAVRARILAGQMHPAHVADVLRMFLLRDHGGLWVDASFFAAVPLPDAVFDAPLFSPHRADDQSARYPSDSRWVIGLMGGQQGHVIFRYMADALSEYWTKCEGAVCPLLTDCLLRAGYQRIPAIREAVDALKTNGAHIYDLAPRANERVNRDALRALTEDTFAFRFSWRGTYVERTPEGDETWFGYLSGDTKEGA